MNAAELVAELDRRGVTLTLVSGDGPGPTIVTDAPRGAIDDALATEIRNNRTMVVSILLGKTTGHVYAPCNVCGEPSMVHAEREIEVRCRMTFGCGGRHTPVDVKPPSAKGKQPDKSRLPGDVPLFDPDQRKGTP